MATWIFLTGWPLADAALQAVVTQFEGAFPRRVAAYYLEGSYADGTAVATSDLDLTIVLVTPFASAAEAEQARQLAEACSGSVGPALDLTLVAESELREHADPMFKLGARLVSGRDVREGVPLLPIGAWARQRMHAAFWLMINVLERPQPVRAPLVFPRSEAPLYGYAERRVRLADGREIHTTRNLVRVMGWIATARIAHEAGQYVVRKRDCAVIYRQAIHDEWTSLLEQIDQQCLTAWQYRVPDEPGQQAELRALLARTLAFENHFLDRYRDFLVSELGSGDSQAQRIAVERLGHTLLVDAGVRQALAQLKTDDVEILLKAGELVRQADRQT